jgi:hypothetical protein
MNKNLFYLKPLNLKTMKKTILAISILLSLAIGSNAQQSSAPKRMPVQLIDQAHNPVRHWRIFVFETTNASDLINVADALKNFQKVKGFLNMQPIASEQATSRRLVLYFEENMDLLKSLDLEKILAANNLVLINSQKK